MKKTVEAAINKEKDENYTYKRISRSAIEATTWLHYMVNIAITCYFITFVLSSPDIMFDVVGNADRVTYMQACFGLAIFLLVDTFLIKVVLSLYIKQEGKKNGNNGRSQSKKLEMLSSWYWDKIGEFCCWSFLTSALEASAALSLTHSFSNQATGYSERCLIWFQISVLFYILSLSALKKLKNRWDSTKADF